MIEIHRNMPAPMKLELSNTLVEEFLLPVLENYHGRKLEPRERKVVMQHVSMLFMEPCPLDLLCTHDKRFAEALLLPRN